MRSILLLAFAICTLMVVNGGVVKRSDDVNTDIQTLQTLVQQQAAAISTLQATVSALQASVNSQQGTINGQQAAFNSQQATINSQQVKITGLENKVQTLSKPVAFTARFSHDDGNNGIPLGLHQTLVFDYVITNAGNAYSPTTGIFTSPLAGYYAFSMVAMEPVTPAHPNLALGIIKNGGVVDQMFVENEQSGVYEQGSTHSVIHLAAGDQVWIRQEGSGDGVRGDVWTVFTGYLVHVD